MQVFLRKFINKFITEMDSQFVNVNNEFQAHFAKFALPDLPIYIFYTAL